MATTSDNVTPLWRATLLRGQQGGLLHVPANAITILAHDDDWRGVLAWDAFSLAVRTMKRPPWFPDDGASRSWSTADEWGDADTVRLQSWLQRRWALKLGLDAVWSVLRIAAERHTVHPVRDYLDGLDWDGVRRLPSWLPTYLGGEPSGYAENVGAWVLTGAVARAYQAGCKLDTMLILEGPQGARKSSALRALFEPWFSDTPIDLESKDRFSALRGVWAVELAELDSFRRADANRIKSFLSSPFDRYRPAYGRAEIVVPRSAILVGSTNADEYLTDATGARRFWPWRCGQIELGKLRDHRDLLWAEAREAYRSGARWWPEAAEAELLKAQQDDRSSTDAWQTPISGWLAVRLPEARVTVAEVLGDALGLDRGRWGQAEMTRAARCLKVAGWVKVRLRDGLDRAWAYQRAGSGSVLGPNGMV